MRTPAEAIAAILDRIEPLRERESVPLEDAAGRVLGAPVVSDVDLPPFEKSAMDGFALRASEPGAGGGELACVGESRAGLPFAGEVPPGACVEIYTGAELPAGLDAVVMVEETTREGDRVHFERAARPGQHVSHRAEILAVGRSVFEAGRVLSAPDLAVLAAVGCDPVPVLRRPRISVLTTGDELVAPAAVPGPGQIREGNTYTLRAAARAAGCELRDAGRVPDDAGVLKQRFAAALEEGDALVTSGGVSMGRYDLVGEAFEAIGVEPVLHKVAIKPGKPIWFGMRGAKPVFGLPGNPVSSMLGFEVFVRPALARLSGAGPEAWRERLRRGRWHGAATEPHWRQQNLPARVALGADGVDELEPLPWLGSADVVGVAAADALAVVPADAVLRPGDLVDYRPLGRG